MAALPEQLKVLIACGGTGGHVYPGVAIAQALSRMKPQAKIVFAGTQRGLEGSIVPRMGWELISVGSTSIKDREVAGRVLAYLRLPFSVIGAMGLLKKERPDLLIGIGGYAAGPLTLAASVLKIPNAIVEPNAIAGMANRLLGRFTRRVYTGFAEAAQFFPAAKVLLTGNPVREEIISLGRNTRAAREQVTVFCFGGSQGALAVNRALMSALPHLAAGRGRFKFVHQVGEKEDIEAVKETYARHNFEAEVFRFTNRIWEFYREADVVVARSGATTVAEISVIGLPAVFVPYPFAADNHQQANAMAVARSGGAVVIPQAELTGERLAAELLKLTADRLAVMRAALAAAGKPQAAERIVEDGLKLIGMK